MKNEKLTDGGDGSLMVMVGAMWSM